MTDAATDEALAKVRFAQPFHFLRHGETVYNREGRFQGQRDTALSPLGHEQAARAAETIAALPGRPISRIVASPLSRARITAEAVAERLSLPIETDPDLMECHLGIHQGEPYADWMPDYWRGRYDPEGGENFWQFRARVVPAMARATARPGTLIVVHGGLWYAARSLVTMEPDIPTMPNCLPLRVAPYGARWQVTVLDPTAAAAVAGAGPANGSGGRTA